MHRTSFLTAILLASSLSVSAQLVEESGSLIGFMADSEPGCAYDNWISHIVEGIARPGYNVYAPAELDPQLNGFGEFHVIPDTPWGLTVIDLFADLADLLLAGQVHAAQARLEQGPAVDYELVRFQDSDSGHELLILREQLDGSYVDPGDPDNPDDDVVGSFNRGWGIFIFDPAAARPRWVVQAPHPNDDYLSGYMAVDTFLRHGAGLLMINGAGREVAHTGLPGDYTNGSSLSDPTRNCVHPFATIHERAVDHWRAQGTVERTLQLHSYDDASHRDLKSCVVSEGRHRRLVHPPLLDMGGGSQGLYNNLIQPVHGAWSFGFTHSAVDLQTFVAHQALNTIYVDGGTPGEQIPLAISASLWGHPTSCQEVYSHDDLQDCHQEEDWIHVELDELPTLVHDLGEDFWYFIDGNVARWDQFARVRSYYRPLFDALAVAEDSLAAGNPGPAPTRVENLHLTEVDVDRLVMRWDPLKSTEFDSYEMLLDPSGSLTENALVFNYEDHEALCWAPLNHLELEDLDYQVTYAIAFRGKDLLGRTGPLSDTLLATPDDLVPPRILSRFPTGHQRYWIQPGGGEVTIRLTDADHLVDVSSLQWRADNNGDGSYDGIFEPWRSAGTEGDGGTVQVTFLVETTATGFVKIEFRVHDNQHPIYGCSGTEMACGIEDDWELGIDPDPPADWSGIPQVTTLVDSGELRLEWSAQTSDSTFFTYQVALSNEPIVDFDAAPQLLDRSDESNLGDPGELEVEFEPLFSYGEQLYMRMRQLDAAGNAGAASTEQTFAYWDPALCSVHVDSLTVASSLLHLYWSTECQPEGLGAVGWWLHALEHPWEQPTETTRLMYLTSPTATLAWPAQSARPFFRVVAEVEVLP